VSKSSQLPFLEHAKSRSKSEEGCMTCESYESSWRSTKTRPADGRTKSLTLKDRGNPFCLSKLGLVGALLTSDVQWKAFPRKPPLALRFRASALCTALPFWIFQTEITLHKQIYLEHCEEQKEELEQGGFPSCNLPLSSSGVHLAQEWQGCSPFLACPSLHTLGSAAWTTSSIGCRKGEKHW
jgi:hypothetical protein